MSKHPFLIIRTSPNNATGQKRRNLMLSFMCRYPRMRGILGRRKSIPLEVSQLSYRVSADSGNSTVVWIPFWDNTSPTQTTRLCAPPKSLRCKQFRIRSFALKSIIKSFTKYTDKFFKPLNVSIKKSF